LENIDSCGRGEDDKRGPILKKKKQTKRTGEKRIGRGKGDGANTCQQKKPLTLKNEEDTHNR